MNLSNKSVPLEPDEIKGAANFYTSPKMKKDFLILPPYGALVKNYKEADGLIVCTGSKSWDLAKRQGWIPAMPKTVFPFGENPERYKWPCENRTVMVNNLGEHESYERLVELAKCLLEHGAVWVLLSIKGMPMTKFQRPVMLKKEVV